MTSLPGIKPAVVSAVSYANGGGGRQIRWSTASERVDGKLTLTVGFKIVRVDETLVGEVDTGRIPGSSWRLADRQPGSTVRSQNSSTGCGAPACAPPKPVRTFSTTPGDQRIFLAFEHPDDLCLFLSLVAPQDDEPGGLWDRASGCNLTADSGMWDYEAGPSIRDRKVTLQLSVVIPHFDGPELVERLLQHASAAKSRP